MCNDPNAVMLFAAGFGTRMRHLTADRPKPLVPVGGRALIDHTITLARAINPHRIVANVHYQPEMMQRHLQSRNVIAVLETPEILETGGGLRAALPVLGDGPVFTANTDAIWQGPNPFTLLKQAWRATDMDALLLCLPLDAALGHTGRGDFIADTDGRLIRGAGLVYGGIQIIKTEQLHDIPNSSFSLNLLWDQMLEQGRLFGLSYPGHWCDVGSPEGVILAETLLEKNNV